MKPIRALLGALILVVGIVAVWAIPSNAPPTTAQFSPGADAIAGRLLFEKDGSLWVWSAGRTRKITDGETWRQPQWSPDGSEIAYVYRGPNFSDIFVMSADGAATRRLTRSQSSSLSDNDWVFRPTWSPSGAQIAFVSDGNSYNPSVWIMNREGSEKHALGGSSAFQQAADGLSWSPDAKRLAVTSFGAEMSQIVLLDVARGTSLPFTESPRGAIDPAWSPDGSTLAYAVRESGRMGIRLRRLDGSSEIEISREGLARSPSWSPDGHQLAFLSEKGGTFELYVVDLVSDSGRTGVRNERQLTKDLNIDATSGVSWGS